MRIDHTIPLLAVLALVLFAAFAPPVGAQDFSTHLRALVMEHADGDSMGIVWHAQGEDAWSCALVDQRLTCEFSSGPKTWECDLPDAEGDVVCRETGE